MQVAFLAKKRYCPCAVCLVTVAVKEDDRDLLLLARLKGKMFV